jgi:hypothetical protein
MLESSEAAARPSSIPSAAYGTGVTLNDLYGNKIYLNQDPE